ncbi:MAG TPA: hypothetical protein VJ763_08340 [Sphingomicrobium sp.]|nr:hypothetical protein [Sphingomicrobium sp.]
MKFFVLKSTVGLIALVTGSAALAQHEHHGQPTPAPAPAPAPQQAPAPADPHAGHDMAAPAPETAADPHAGHDMSAIGGHAMAGALGSYPMAREASGTAWQPDSSEHTGIHLSSGDWSFMIHGNVDLVYSWQEAPRGDEELFPAGMIMGMARRPLGDGTLQFKAMISPDPLMGKKGYPLLLASGETANGRDPLVDRQHPHDFFMELSASVSQNIGEKTSLFIYGGLPGEPAFGPPAFMHRQSISVSPEAPISHHWLDSTHITFGVLTAGLVHDNFKLEVSRFNGREPDEHRWDIETGPLDSTSVRLSWNPTANLSLQGSWGHFEEPEQLEPGVNQRRWSASGTYTKPMPNGWWSTALAWGRKGIEGENFDAFALESSLNWKDWTLFGRGEITENNELLVHHDEEEGEDHHGEAFTVGKVSLGLVRDFRLAPNLKLGLGGLYAFNFVPEELEEDYGGDPQGAMAFVRLKID